MQIYPQFCTLQYIGRNRLFLVIYYTKILLVFKQQNMVVNKTLHTLGCVVGCKWLKNSKIN